MSVLSAQAIFLAVFIIGAVWADEPHLNDPGYKCVPKSTFQHECNTCTCNDEGTFAACTLKACIDLPKQKRQTKQVCVPDSTYMDADGCNTCKCNKAGTFAACTLKYCPPKQKRSAPELIVITQDPESYTCEQGKNYKYLCNTCHCVKGDKLACTKMSCEPFIKRSAPTTDEIVHVTGDVTQVKCEQGKAYKYECNDCQCLSDGKLACSRRVCAPHEKHKRSTDDEVIMVKASEIADYKCESDKKYRYECNECKCIQEKLACTRRMCAPGETRRKREDKKPKIGDPDYRCTPGTTFLDDEGCNTCFCEANGKDVGCTDMACSETNPRKRSTKPKIGDPDYRCTPGTTFLDDDECNTCHCEENGKDVRCTDMLCAKKPATKPKIGDPDYRCTPGSTFLDDEGCNSCFCADNGKDVGCTAKLCITKPVQKRETSECKEGETKTINCNTCTCEKIGWVCTKKACVTLPDEKQV